MRKREVTAVAIFIIVFVLFLHFSNCIVMGQDKTEPVSKAEIVTNTVSPVPLPKGEAKQEHVEIFTSVSLPETSTDSTQPEITAEPEEVPAEPEEAVETAVQPSEEEVYAEPEQAEETYTEEPEQEYVAEPEEVYQEPEQSYSESYYYGTCTITGFCNCELCSGGYAYGPTASGAYPTEGWTVASNSLPLGTLVYIQDLGTFCVEDRGDSIMDDMWLDVFWQDHDIAQSFGMKYLDVYIVG